MATASASTLVSATNSARLVRIGDQLVVGELALEAVAVLRLAHAALQAAEHADLALDRHAAVCAISATRLVTPALYS